MRRAFRERVVIECGQQAFTVGIAEGGDVAPVVRRDLLDERTVNIREFCKIELAPTRKSGEWRKCVAEPGEKVIDGG